MFSKGAGLQVDHSNLSSGQPIGHRRYAEQTLAVVRFRYRIQTRRVEPALVRAAVAGYMSALGY